MPDVSIESNECHRSLLIITRRVPLRAFRARPGSFKLIRMLMSSTRDHQLGPIMSPLLNSHVMVNYFPSELLAFFFFVCICKLFSFARV